MIMDVCLIHGYEFDTFQTVYHTDIRGCCSVLQCVAVCCIYIDTFQTVYHTAEKPFSRNGCLFDVYLKLDLSISQMIK